MEYDSRAISISEIDTADATLRLSLKVEPGSLVASVEAVGLINPPLLAQKKDETYRIVCGFRRVKACQVLGWKRIRAHVVGGDQSELDLLKLAILDNQSHRPLNVIEQARGIRKLGPHLPSKGRLEALASLLRFPPNKKVFEKIMAVDGLPEAIQEGVLEETVSFEAAAHLAGLSHGDGLSFFDLLKGLKLSQNKQIEIIVLVEEIARREDLQVDDVLQSKDVTTVMDRPDLNRNEKAAALRAYLRRRRFPSLTKMEAEFSEALKALKLTKEISITPPPYFEGGPYVLRMTFRGMDDFHKGCKILEGIAENPALKRALDH
ncbi:MAG: ParB N-terminal domain-containing protein [Thermodesulfobacteriota bacterium]|nr:ParB N-terminal domain-containing protein [Thermodesulfobacteriota bacterium]